MIRIYSWLTGSRNSFLVKLEDAGGGDVLEVQFPECLIYCCIFLASNVFCVLRAAVCCIRGRVTRYL